jgi:hypothetical protein
MVNVDQQHNLMVNADQQHNLPTQTQNKAGNERITVTFCSECLTIVDVENQYIVLILCVCL